MSTYSLNAYRELMDFALQSGYGFMGFRDERVPRERNIRLRLDVDISLSMAVEMARCNEGLGIQATFFLLLRSQIYNLLSPWSLESAREILQAGQRLALHVPAPRGILPPECELTDLVTTDYQIMRRELPKLEPVFAWHNPTPRLLKRCLTFAIPGMVNCYAEKFVKHAPYHSDSNLRNTFDDLRTIVKKNRSHVMTWLLHPMNWVAGGDDPETVLANTWPFIIRDRELGILENNSYRASFPDGMPAGLLEDFARAWLSTIPGRDPG